jgi:hypothetical protein
MATLILSDEQVIELMKKRRDIPRLHSLLTHYFLGYQVPIALKVGPTVTHSEGVT